MAMNEKAEKYFNNGMKCFKNRDFEGAVNYFTEAIKSGGNVELIYENRGTAYLCMYNYQKAIDDFTKAMELGGSNELIYENSGIAYLGIGDYLKAIEDLTKVINLGENDSFIYGCRGIAYLGIDKHQSAIEDLTKAIELGGTDKSIYRYRGIAYICTKDYPKAIRDFKKVIKHNRNNEGNRNENNYIRNEIELTDNILNLMYYLLKSNELKVLPDNETLNLIRLVYLCYDLMEEIKIKPSEMGEQFVHYTKAGTLQYLLKKDYSAKLRLNNAVYMNDPEEGQILKRVLCQLDQNKGLENLLKDEDVKNYTYLTCFCPYDKRDELPMWIHYGDGGKGIGLVFHNSFFDKTDLYKVQYIDVKKADIDELNQNVQDKITAILNLLKKDDIKNNDHKEFKDYVNIILNYVSYLFKDKAYEYEGEVRILNYRDYSGSDIQTKLSESGIPRLFIEYDKGISNENCVEVIVGPKAQYTEIAAYAKYVGIQKVSQSEIKYR